MKVQVNGLEEAKLKYAMKCKTIHHELETPKADDEGGGLSPYKHAFVLTKKQEVTLLDPTTWTSSTYCVTQQYRSLTQLIAWLV
jgi:hypothetical protein